MSASRQRGRGRKQPPSNSVPPTVKSYVKQYVKGQLNADEELKHFPTVVDTTAVSTAGFVQDLSIVAQGTTSQNRTGDEVRAKILNFRLGIVGADATNFIRITFVKWKMNDSNDAVTLSDVFYNYSKSAMSLFSPTVPNRFHVLYDKTVGVGTSGTACAVVKGSVPLNHIISYNFGGTGGINHIYALIVSDSSAASHPTFTLDADFCFTDS